MGWKLHPVNLAISPVVPSQEDWGVWADPGLKVCRGILSVSQNDSDL